MALDFPIGASSVLPTLRQDSPGDALLMRDLWSRTSAPSLLDALPEKGRRRSGYTYDPLTGRYTEIATGRTVTASQLRAYANQASNEAALRMRKTTQQLIAGVILLSVWHAEMQSLMRALYRTIWVLSIGGFVFEDDTARNLFYLFVLSQFSWLDNFAAQISSGAQALNGSALSRAGMYGLYGNALHQNIPLIRAEGKGYSQAKRILALNENHCHDSADRPGCVELAALGWIPIAEMVPIGDATCWSYCLCRIIYQ